MSEDILYDWVYIQESKNESALPIDMRYNAGHKLQVIGYSIVMVISAIGNITVLTLLIKRRLKTHSRIDVLLTHLAIADLLVTFLMMPLEIAWASTVQWLAGDVTCRLMAFLRTFGLYLSSFVLVCISMDRCFAVLQPLHLTKGRGKIMILIAWILSFLCSAPQAYIFHVEAHPNVTWYFQCVVYNAFNHETHQIVYDIFAMLFMYALPLLIITCSYICIYVEIFKHSRMPNSEGFRRSSIEILGRAKRRTLKMTISIVMVFVVCWTPYYVISIWYWFDKPSAFKLDQRLQKGLFLFACTNSCMNPIVYGVYNIKVIKNRRSTIGNETHSSIVLRNAVKCTRHSESTLTTPERTSLADPM